MSESPVVQTSYVIATSDDEYTRLASIAENDAAYVRDGCRRTGLHPVAAVVEVGCGAPGALLVLAEVVGPQGTVVGPQGTVVGLDVNAETVARAREFVERRSLRNVSVVQADLQTLDSGMIGPPGRFDLAYCRLFLVHQADAAATVRRMAALVRSGGHLLMQEPLLDMRLAEPPFVEPASAAFREYYRVLLEVIRRGGGHPEMARYLDEVLSAAGVEVIGQHLYSAGVGPRGVGPLAHSLILSLKGLRPALVAYQVATDAEVDALVRGLTAAQAVPYRTFLVPLNVEAIARVP